MPGQSSNGLIDSGLIPVSAPQACPVLPDIVFLFDTVPPVHRPGPPVARGWQAVHGTELPSKVLIVDDNGLTRKSVRELLSDHFIQVCGEAENGKEAIEKFKQLQPDIVLLDVNMPVMNGVQAACEIRGIAPSTKILLLTIYGGPEHQAAAALLGVDGFIDKSAAGTQLIPALRRLMPPIEAAPCAEPMPSIRRLSGLRR
jgi:CheY-like chemotaxis protein